MATSNLTPTVADPDTDATAIHEAGHAVLQVVLRLGVQSVTIVPNSQAGSLGVSAHSGDYGRAAEQLGDDDDETFQLKLYAEDAFFSVMRLPIARESRPCGRCGPRIQTLEPVRSTAFGKPPIGSTP